MKEGWEYKKLGEFIEEYSVRDKGKGFPVFSVTNSQGFCQEYFDKNVASKDTTNYKVVPFGYFAYNPSRINVGSVALQNQMDNVSVSPLYVVFAVSEKIRQDFLLYYLKSDYCMTYINAYSRGAVRNNLRLSTLKTFDIPYYSIDKQQRIVEELDLLSSIIEKKKEQLKELDNLAQSIFYDMFGDPVTNEKGWEKKKIGELASVKTGPFGSMLHKEDYISKGIPLVNPIHIKDFHIVADMDFTISDEKAEELNKYILQKDDVVFARRGDIGRCAVVSEEENGYLCGTGSLFVRFIVEVASTYIMYIIRSSSFTKELISNAKGATMLNLNSSIIENLWLPLPPLSLQQQFASKIEAIEQQKELIKQSIKEVETLFNSRMDYYFN